MSPPHAVIPTQQAAAIAHAILGPHTSPWDNSDSSDGEGSVASASGDSASSDDEGAIRSLSRSNTLDTVSSMDARSFHSDDAESVESEASQEEGGYDGHFTVTTLEASQVKRKKQRRRRGSRSKKAKRKRLLFPSNPPSPPANPPPTSASRSRPDARSPLDDTFSGPTSTAQDSPRDARHPRRLVLPAVASAPPRLPKQCNTMEQLGSHVTLESRFMSIRMCEVLSQISPATGLHGLSGVRLRTLRGGYRRLNRWTDEARYFELEPFAYVGVCMPLLLFVAFDLLTVCLFLCACCLVPCAWGGGGVGEVVGFWAVLVGQTSGKTQVVPRASGALSKVLMCVSVRCRSVSHLPRPSHGPVRQVMRSSACTALSYVGRRAWLD